jgi:hypothetical protein
MRGLPRPTEEQLKSFADHVLAAHSWYKHLPPTGERFVFFVAADAGEGYTEAQPRYHYSWRTTEEYRRRFGFLDYQWEYGRDQGWYRDSTEIDPPSEVIFSCTCVLLPTCSTSGDAIDFFLGTGRLMDYAAEHDQALHHELLALERDNERLERAWFALDEQQRQLLDSLKEGDASPSLPDSVLAAFRLERAVENRLESWRKPQRAGLKLALNRLSALLAQEG